MMDHFEQWELNVDMKSSKANKTTNATKRPDDYGYGIAAQIGLKKKKTEPKGYIGNLSKAQSNGFKNKTLPNNSNELKPFKRLPKHSNKQLNDINTPKDFTLKKIRNESTKHQKAVHNERLVSSSTEGSLALADARIPVATEKRFDNVAQWINKHSDMNINNKDIVKPLEELVPKQFSSDRNAQKSRVKKRSCSDDIGGKMSKRSSKNNGLESGYTDGTKNKFIQDEIVEKKIKLKNGKNRTNLNENIDTSMKSILPNLPHHKKLSNQKMLQSLIAKLSGPDLEDSEMKELFGSDNESASKSQLCNQNHELKTEVMSPVKKSTPNTELLNERTNQIKKEKNPSPSPFQSTDKTKSKKIRPVSFTAEVIKINAFSQTETNKHDIKKYLEDIEESEQRKPVKFKMSLLHDQYVNRIETSLFDSKRIDITEIVKSIIDKYKPKVTASNSNCFMTLDSRFQILNTGDMKLLEVLPEDIDDTVAQELDPIRIYTTLTKQYQSFLPDAYRDNVPEIVITRILPTKTSNKI